MGTNLLSIFLILVHKVSSPKRSKGRNNTDQIGSMRYVRVSEKNSTGLKIDIVYKKKIGTLDNYREGIQS